MTVIRSAQLPWSRVKSSAFGWGDRMSRSKVVRYALSGALLALGAPLGWVAVRACALGLDRSALLAELQGQALLYGYLLVATAVAFTAFGARAGMLADRLVQ